jgi:Zn-dependent oligopeptidase
MTNVFGTPIYIHSAEEAKSNSKAESMSSRLKDILNTVQPLEKVSTALESCTKLLDGTGYEDIKKAISQLKQNVDEKVNEIVMQISGGQGVQNQAQQPNPSNQASPSNSVPTAGQISGRDPLPGETNV